MTNEHNTPPAAAPAPAEPFGYFRVDALGWTDCAATDEGAIALYERPAAPAVPQGEPVYQLARATGPVADAWIDVAKDVYDDAGFHPSDFKRRILYAAPSQEPAVPQGWKPVGYLRSDEFDGHVFEPIDGTWPFDELLFSLSTSPEPVQEVTLTDDQADAVSMALRRAWQLGQTYWQQADSDYISQQKKSDETQRKFEKLCDDTIAALREKESGK